MMAVGMAIVALNLMAARRAGVMGSRSHNLGFVTAVFLILVVIVGSLVWGSGLPARHGPSSRRPPQPLC
jgi:hypothetical protein